MDYSVIIRTTGKAGEKYRSLLHSIENSTIKPVEVIVVLPEGYDKPKEQLGYEKFFFCKKGMVNQRFFGLSQCKTEYAFVTDDDISFGSDFIDRVSSPVVSGDYAISIGPLIEFLPKKGKEAFVYIITAHALPTIFHKNRYNTVLKTTGYSYNRHLEYGKGRLYETQSAPGACCFVNVSKLRSIHFEDELWLEKHGYAAYEDEAMYYKAWINGLKTVLVADAHFNHLDGKTSQQKNNSGIGDYCYAFNKWVFWRRFIYERKSPLGKIWCRICFGYHLFATSFIGILLSAIKRSGTQSKVAARKGKKDAKQWIKTEEYRNLPPVVIENKGNNKE